MKTKTFYLATIVSFVWIILGQSYAATIPAGTTLVVRTLQAISAIDQPGTPFTAQLENNVTANGKVVLPAGTKLSGKVQTAKRTTTSTTETNRQSHQRAVRRARGPDQNDRCLPFGQHYLPIATRYFRLACRIHRAVR